METVVEVNHLGLSRQEAAERLHVQGPNRLPPAPRPPIWRVLGRQLVHFFAIMLWVAGLLAFVARMPQLGTAIFAVIVVNALFAFLQEYRAERAAERLRVLLPRHVTVRRDGALSEINADELVTGDLVVLRPGDRISADLTLIETHNLELDASTLTGESVPVRSGDGDTAYAGTFVVNGAGDGIVSATDSTTRLAGIARLTRAGQRPPSPLARELDRVVRTIAAIAVGVGVAFFIIATRSGCTLSGSLPEPSVHGVQLERRDQLPRRRYGSTVRSTSRSRSPRCRRPLCAVGRGSLT